MVSKVTHAQEENGRTHESRRPAVGGRLTDKIASFVAFDGIVVCGKFHPRRRDDRSCQGSGQLDTKFLSKARMRVQDVGEESQG